MMMAILMTIIALAVVLYAAAMVFKRRYKMRAEEVRNQVESIEKASLDADFAKLSQMTLSGDSLTEVENMDKSYHYLMNRRLPEIIEELDSNPLALNIACYNIIDDGEYEERGVLRYATITDFDSTAVDGTFGIKFEALLFKH